jgi:hypothetical protein
MKKNGSLSNVLRYLFSSTMKNLSSNLTIILRNRWLALVKQNFYLLGLYCVYETDFIFHDAAQDSLSELPSTKGTRQNINCWNSQSRLHPLPAWGLNHPSKNENRLWV